MNLPFRDPPLSIVASASLPQPGDTRLFSDVPKELFLKTMSEFYDKTSGNVDGFRPQDFLHVWSSARRGRHRGGRADGLYFSENPARQSIVDHFRQRLLNVSRCEIFHQYKLLNSALCWAFLQVADMGEMENMKIMLAAPTMPKLFKEIEEIFIAWSLQFRICESSIECLS